MNHLCLTLAKYEVLPRIYSIPFCSWQNLLGYLINVHVRPPARKIRDSFILSLSLCLSLVLEIFSVPHLGGFLGISQHVSFQHHNPRAKENMAWKGEMRSTISVFLQVQDEWNKSFAFNIHINNRAI